MDFEERLKYINRQMAIMDYNTDMRVSREEGLADGRKAGREEMAIDIARDMLRDNKPIEEIAKYTKLSEERGGKSDVEENTCYDGACTDSRVIWQYKFDNAF